MYRQCLLRLIQSTEGRSSSPGDGCLGLSDVAFALLVFLLFFFFFFLDAVACWSPAGASVASSGDAEREECDEGGVGGSLMSLCMSVVSHNMVDSSDNVVVETGIVCVAMAWTLRWKS